MKQLSIFSLALCLATTAAAGETVTVSPSPTPAPRFKISGWIDSGITFNPASPQDNQNFGRFFDDRANEPLLNQLVINFERALAPQPGEFDWGFKLQFMYGSDARFIHSLGLFSNTAGTSIVQPDLPEGYLSLHLPIISEGGLNLLDGKLTILATTSIGPETPNDNHDQRYLNCITTTWKITDKLTSITDLNYARDDGADADAYGIAQYFTYAINSWLIAGIRGEVFSDQQGFYVVSFANTHDPMRALEGEPTIDPRTVGGGHTTYGAITAGVNIKPTMAKPISSLNIRPELRYDRALNGTHPFNQSSDVDQFTVGVDCILTF